MNSSISLQKKKFIVKCDSPAKVFFLWSRPCLHNISRGLLETTPESIKLYYAPLNTSINKKYLFEGPMSNHFLNACFLFFLLDNPEYVPTHWRNDCQNYPRKVLFGGTIYSSSSGDFILLLEIWKNRLDVGYEDLEFSIDNCLPFAIV